MAIPVLNLLEDFRSAVLTRNHLPGLSSLSMLEDIVIHSLDIRRPLLRDHAVPESRMVMVAADLWTSHFFSGYKLFAGLQVAATDADWSAGDSPEILGPIEDLLLAMSGRFAGLDQLEGDGVATVRDRAFRSDK